jgi:hypothetical protein
VWWRGIRTDQRWDAGVGARGGKPGSGTRVWHPLDVDQHATVEPAERGKHDTSSEEDCRDGRSGEGLNHLCSHASFLDPAIATTRYFPATHCRKAHLILESASPDKRGGSHSKQGCSMDAQTVGRWVEGSIAD